MMINKIADKIKELDGTAYLVGGAVRDELFGFDSLTKDFDIEVFGLTYNQLIQILSEFGVVNAVGSSFGVIKLRTNDGQEFDFSFPRRESKTQPGHKGFLIKPDPFMTVEEAQKRRDFTINSASKDLSTGEIIDNFGAKRAIDANRLVATSHFFRDDPLRVLRGMQFAGRFDLICDDNDTIDMCRQMFWEFYYLPKERIWEEWWKWASKSIRPSRGLEFLEQTKWIWGFKEIDVLSVIKQHPEWHPEGDVWAHTKLVCDAAADIAIREKLSEEDRGVLVLSALLHDVGKAVTTEWSEEKNGWASPGHDLAGVPIAKKFLNSIKCPHNISDRVLQMVREHMVHVYSSNPDKRYVRRFQARLKHASFDDIMRIIEADHSGRPPLPRGLPKLAIQMCEIADEIGKEIKPILLGRHLIAMGLKPGKSFSKILADAFKAQQDGKFETLEQGQEWLVQYVRNFPEEVE